MTQATIKQAPGDGRCVACTAAMAAGDETTESFQRFVAERFSEAKPPYSDLQAYAYLLERKLVVGLGFMHPKFCPDETMTLKFNARDFPAYVVVQSPYRDVTHAVYWDGKKIRDPDPRTPDGKPINQYQILLWVPIYRIE